MGGGAHAAGDVHAPPHDVEENPAANAEQLLILILIRQIRHGAVQIQRPHAVSLRRFHLTHRQMILGMFGWEHLIQPFLMPPPLLHKPPAQLQISLFTGVAIQLYQRQLDFLMPGGEKGGRLFVLEYPLDIIGIPAHQPEEFLLAGGVGVSHRRLKQMPGAVQLVIRPAGKARLRLTSGEIGVEIPVRVLMVRYAIHQFVHRRLQLGIRLLFQEESSGFHPLGHVGIPENVGLVGHSLPPVAAESVKPPGFLKALIHVPNGNVAVDTLPFLPKSLIQIHLLKGNRLVSFHSHAPLSRQKQGIFLHLT